MSGLDITAATPILKELYQGQTLQNVLYPENAAWAWLPKKKANFVGSQYPIPIIHGNPQLISASASVAFSGTPTSSKAKRFVLTRVDKYGAARISRETLKAADGDLGSFIDGARMEMDGGFNSMGRRLAVEAFRDGTGCIGKITAGAAVNDAGGVLSITSYSGGSQGSDIDNFEIGMKLIAAATVSGATRTGSMYVVAVDRINSTITVSATDGGSGSDPSALITGLAASDFLFCDGDAANNGGTKLCISGFDAWLPFTLAEGESFFGVNRNADPQRLAGVHVDGTTGTLAGAPLQQLLLQGAAQCGKFGGRPKVAFCNWETWTSLVNELGSKVMYDAVTSADNADIAFKSVRVHGGRDPIDVVPDQNCPAGRIYLLDQTTWGLYALGDAIEFVDDDGVIMLRASGADAFDARLASMLQVGCNAPGKNCVIKTS